MRSYLVALSVASILLITLSCTNSANKSEKAAAIRKDTIEQKEDGTINLNLGKASCYNDITNPSCNTAEWNFVVSRAGRYKVWLSSATIDTMDLQYTSTVKINLLDERIDMKPVRDKIVLNTSDVKYPYYRADSYMGSFYFQQPGEYSIQVISDKIIAQSANSLSGSDTSHTKLISLFLTPMTR